MTTLIPIRYYGPYDVWHYTTENRPLEDIEANLILLRDQIDLNGFETTTISDLTDTSHSLTLTDAKKYLRLNNASSIYVQVPTNANQAFTIGTIIRMRQVGAGTITLVPLSGVTLLTRSTLTSSGQGASIEMIKVATNTWDVSGDLA